MKNVAALEIVFFIIIIIIFEILDFGINGGISQWGRIRVAILNAAAFTVATLEIRSKFNSQREIRRKFTFTL